MDSLQDQILFAMQSQSVQDQFKSIEGPEAQVSSCSEVSLRISCAKCFCVYFQQHSQQAHKLGATSVQSQDIKINKITDPQVSSYSLRISFALTDAVLY